MGAMSHDVPSARDHAPRAVVTPTPVTKSPPLRRRRADIIAWGTAALAYLIVLVGGLIASRRPRNPIGWLLLFGATATALQGLAGQYAVRTLLVDRGSLPGLVDSVARFHHWRSGLSRGGRAYPSVVPQRSVAVGALASGHVARHRASASGAEREQVRRVAYALETTVLISITYTLVGLAVPAAQNNVVDNVVVVAGFGLGLPAAIGVAMLRYHLYDIDIVISRTLVYSTLAVLITAVYVGIAVGIGTLVGSGGKPNLGLSILATGIVAVGFQPVRERVQRGGECRSAGRLHRLPVRTRPAGRPRCRNGRDMDGRKQETVLLQRKARAGKGNRTLTPLRAQRPERCVSTSSTTPASDGGHRS